MIKICHWSLWAPSSSGLFEAVRDMIKYERRNGIDSIFVHSDVENPDPSRFTIHDEKGLLTASSWKDALDADIWVLHRSIPQRFWDRLQKYKAVAFLHGTSGILTLHEIESAGQNDKFNMHIEFMDNFKKVFTINKSDTDIMKLYETGNRKDKVVYIPDAIDMEYYSLEGPFKSYRYRPAIISTANIRINKNPDYLFWSMPEVMKRIPKARLNVFGLGMNDFLTWRRIILKSPSIANSIENWGGHDTDLRYVIRGADISFNSNYTGIFSRDSMESMAMGCQIVAYSPENTKYACYRQIESIADAICHAWEDRASNPVRNIEQNRAYAEEHFCMDKAVKKLIEEYNKL